MKDQDKITKLAELILNGMKDSELADELAEWLNQIPDLERKREFLRSFKDYIYKTRDNNNGEEIKEKLANGFVLPNGKVLPNGGVLKARVYDHGTLRLRYGTFSITRKFIRDTLTELRNEISRQKIKNPETTISTKEHKKGGKDYEFDIEKTKKWFQELWEKEEYQKDGGKPIIGKIEQEIIKRHGQDTDSDGKPSQETIKAQRRKLGLMQYKF